MERRRGEDRENEKGKVTNLVQRMKREGGGEEVERIEKREGHTNHFSLTT